MIAFETARQIALEGERVIGLVLFNTAAPGYPKIHRHWRRYAAQAREMVAALAHGRRPVSAAGIAAHLRMLGRIASRRFAGRAARALAAVDSSAIAVGREQQSLNALAMRGYSPRPLYVPILHLIAADNPASTRLLDDPRLGWRDFARAGFDVRTVAGDHNSMFDPSHAGALAEQFQTVLVFLK